MYEDDLAELMGEPPGGHNHGRKATGYDRPDGGTWEEGKTVESISLETSSDLGFRLDGGWSTVWPGNGGTRGNPGGNVVHPDEFVDTDLLRDLALDAFGFTAEDVASTYASKNPHLTDDQRQLRARMDARLLALSRSGGNLVKFAEAVGISESTVTRAVRRARAAE